MPFVSHRAFGWQPARVDESWCLDSIPQGMAYALCNSLLCKECGLLFLDIRFSDDEMARLYEDYRGSEYTQLREFYEPGYSIRNAELAHPIVYIHETENFLREFLGRPQRILDWGGNTGINTPFKNEAAEVFIYDISEKIGSDGHLLSDKTRIQGKAFDLVTCLNVLEHVPYPSDVLGSIREYMNSHSLLFIEVPHEKVRVEHPAALLLTKKRHWHEHINFFSETSLKELIKNSRLKILAIRDLATGEKGNQDRVFQIICRRST